MGSQADAECIPMMGERSTNAVLRRDVGSMTLFLSAQRPIVVLLWNELG